MPSSEVKTPIAHGVRGLEPVCVAQVAVDALEVRALQPASITARTQQGLHLVPARHQLVHEVRADESRRACDETFHARSIKALPARTKWFLSHISSAEILNAKPLNW